MSDVKSEVKEPGLWNVLIGWGYAIVYLAIVGSFSFSYTPAMLLGMVFFFAAFGTFVYFNFEWFKNALDFELSDLLGSGYSGISLKGMLDGTSEAPQLKDIMKANKDEGKNK